MGPLSGCPGNNYSVRQNPFDNIYTGVPPSEPGPAPSSAPHRLRGTPGGANEIVWLNSGSTHTGPVQIWEGTMQNTGQVEVVEVGPGQTTTQVAATPLLNARLLTTWYDDPGP